MDFLTRSSNKILVNERVPELLRYRIRVMCKAEVTLETSQPQHMGKIGETSLRGEESTKMPCLL